MPGSASLLLPEDAPGQELYKFDLYATGAFVVAAVASAAVPALRTPFAVLSVALFAAGCVAFIMAFLKSVDRSREEDVSVTMVYLMAGSTPKPISRRFHLLTFVQSAVAIATASIHPFTAQAFGILAAMLGLGLAGLWAARHGIFAERRDGPDWARKQARESSSNG